MLTISVNLIKGGTWKTTTVQAMAEFLTREHDKKVLCIDTDAQCSLTYATGIDPNKTEHDLCDVLKGECAVENAIEHGKYYDIIPSAMSLAAADTMFTSIGKENLLKEKLAGLKGYDVVLIDTAPALSILNVMAMTASDGILIPMEPSRFALQGLEQLNESIELTRKYFNKDLDIYGILVTRFKGNTNLNRTVIQGIPKVAEQMNTKVFETKIRESIKIGEYQLMGLPVTEISCNAISDYRDFVDEFVKEVSL